MSVGNAKELGCQIRKARVDAGITQSALADRCGTTQSWLSELENGKPRAELDLTLRVLRELDFSLETASAEPRAAARVHDPEFDVADLVGMPRSTGHKTPDDDGR